jgi:radical SAM protein with 4Fe4S-binding SPASM domain
MDAPYVISWNVTRKCNLTCTHCYLPAGMRGNSPADTASDELTTGEAVELIDQISLVNPEVMLILSGGEPLLREDIFELSAYASGKGMMVVLGSNGLLIDDSIARTLRRSGVSGISISLDSASPEIHDSVRSCEGAWDAAVRAVGVCRENGLAVQINTVVTRKNCDEIPRLIRYSRTLGAKVYSPFFLVCTGRGEELADISPPQYEKVLSFIVDTGGNHEDMMVRTRCAPTFRRVLYMSDAESPLLRMDTGRCLAGVRYCRVTPEGDVTPCPYMSLSAGNVRTQAFGDLWRNSDLFASLRNPTLKGKCGGCSFRLICGGCRARAYAFSGDYLGEDPWCAHIPGGEDIIQPPSFHADMAADADTAFWTEGAEERLKRVPSFVRPMVRGAVERFAREKKCMAITPELMDELRQKVGRGGMVGH